MKLFDYQKEVIDSNEDIVMNWARNLGSTYTIMNKILKDKPKNVLYIGNNFRIIEDKLRDVVRDIQCLKQYLNHNYRTALTNALFSKNYSDNGYTIIHADGTSTIIDFVREYKSGFSMYDLCVMDKGKSNWYDCNLKNISKQVIIVTNENNFDKHLQNKFSDFKIIQKDYTVGLYSRMYSPSWIKEMKLDDELWYDQFAILDQPKITKTKNDVTINVTVNKEVDMEVLSEKIFKLSQNREIKTLGKFHKNYY